MQQAGYSAIRSEVYEKRFERFTINRAATLMSVKPGLCGITTRNCRLIDISQGSASFEVLTTLGLPLHYYLTIVGTAKRIGCAEVYRRDKRIEVHFIKPIDEALLHQIVRADFFTGPDVLKH